jgi:hypothetical protein
MSDFEDSDINNPKYEAIVAKLKWAQAIYREEHGALVNDKSCLPTAWPPQPGWPETMTCPVCSCWMRLETMVNGDTVWCCMYSCCEFKLITEETYRRYKYAKENAIPYHGPTIQERTVVTEPDRRERIAAQVLSGFANEKEWGVVPLSEMVEAAIEWADALIKELDKKKENKPWSNSF